jgi:hypothetical protein
MSLVDFAALPRYPTKTVAVPYLILAPLVDIEFGLLANSIFIIG